MFGNPLIVNRGIDSDRVEGVLQRLPAILAGQPAKLFLLIGINDIADKKPTEAIISSYKKIVTLVRTQSPQTELYLQSVLPVNHTPYNHYIDNRDVEALNRQIARLADGENSHFVPLHEAFLADNKTELAEQFTYDGVHLSGEGYLTWKQLVEPYLLQISTDK